MDWENTNIFIKTTIIYICSKKSNCPFASREKKNCFGDELQLLDCRPDKQACLHADKKKLQVMIALPCLLVRRYDRDGVNLTSPTRES